MTKHDKAERVLLSVHFHDQDVTLRIAPARYRRILRGGADRVRGDSLSHEEEGPQATRWHFGGGPQGDLVVEYGIGGGQAFVGRLDEARVEIVTIRQKKRPSRPKITTHRERKAN